MPIDSEFAAALQQAGYEIPEPAAEQITDIGILRAAVQVGTPIGLDTPSVLLRLTAPVPTVISRADQHRFTISAREAL